MFDYLRYRSKMRILSAFFAGGALLAVLICGFNGWLWLTVINAIVFVVALAAALKPSHVCVCFSCNEDERAECEATRRWNKNLRDQIGN